VSISPEQDLSHPDHPAQETAGPEAHEPEIADGASSDPGSPGARRSPPVAYAVEVAEGELRLRIQVGPKSIPIAITPEQAGELGAALIGACVLHAEGRVPEPGRILRSDWPVTGWRTGAIREHCLAILLLDILGGPEIALQLQPALAISCGRSLLETGKTLQRAIP
jgi:hypothetical protein